jgi:hypothetical protein
MMSLPAILSSSFLVAVLTGQPAGSHFSSPLGFSFDHPQGWVVATKETRQAVVGETKVALEKLGRVDFGKMAVILFDPCDDEFIENVNVVISPGRLPISEESCRKLTQELSNQRRGSSVRVADQRVEIVTFGNRKAISNRWTMTGLTPGVAIRQWQIVMPGRTQTYTVTASASVANFPRYEARFRGIFASFKPDGGGLGVWYGLPSIAQYAIIGGIVGGIAGAIRVLFKRKDRDREDNIPTMQRQDSNEQKTPAD